MVIGGYAEIMVLSKTQVDSEIMVNSEWTIVASPPSRFYLSAATLANSVSIFGK